MMPDLIEAAALAVSLTSAIFNYVRAAAVSETVVSERIAVLRESLKDERTENRDADKSQTADMKEATATLRAVTTELKVMAAEQAMTNRMNTAALEGVAKKLDLHEKILSEHSATIALIREMLIEKRG